MNTTNLSSEIDWQPEADTIVENCWEDSEGDIEEFKIRLSKVICLWMGDAARYSRNSDFYRDLLDKCTTYMGKEVYTSDDGSIQDSPLRFKIPEIVDRRFKELSGSEAICGFCGWLTTRSKKLVMSSTDDCAPVVDAIKKYCEVNGLTEPRDNYDFQLKIPKS